MAECVFCEIVSGQRDAYILYEDEHSISILDRYPVVPGHTLLIPKIHYCTILDMPPQDVGMLFGLVPRLAPAILDATNTSAFNVGQNNGHAAKQVVPHVHIHIIPRRPEDAINWNARALHNEEWFGHILRSIRGHLYPS